MIEIYLQIKIRIFNYEFIYTKSDETKTNYYAIRAGLCRHIYFDWLEILVATQMIFSSYLSRDHST